MSIPSPLGNPRASASLVDDVLAFTLYPSRILPILPDSGHASHLSFASAVSVICRRTACCHEQSDTGSQPDQLLRAGAREPDDLMKC